ncbi:D-alanyl-D-alanine carboxypeptidase family protein [Streptomyces alfalfae]|uniref:D-alanyl-D-alanine carboxypeptidase family protein n=1 Tax=Streptomyces alfalfae TaxID=1642299 RepID=UPI001FD0292A|nr:serine hydrolase [Streptomyces alfalfae]
MAAVALLLPLLLLTTKGCLNAPAGDDRRAGAATVLADLGPGSQRSGQRLPWPSEGQSSLVVEGTGHVGTTGGQRPVPIASLTKVMTATVLLRSHPIGAGEAGPSVTVDRRAEAEAGSSDESTAPVREGQRLPLRRMLELMLLPSANNVARLLARWDAGSQQAFVRKMNRVAKTLGMTRTTYTGASGFEPTTTSTADDQMKLARHAMRHPVLRAVVATRHTRVPGVPGTVRNTNRLLEQPGVVGLKTGSSTPAGGNLMWAAHVGPAKTSPLAIGVVLGQRAGTSPAQGLDAAFSHSEALLDALRERLPAALAGGGRARS